MKFDKKLIIINGIMGVGKTATSKELNKKPNNSVRLDDDWCWMMNPFTVNDQNKNMVIKKHNLFIHPMNMLFSTWLYIMKIFLTFYFNH
ncbi:AAA family ATPase [Clostridium botulinum]|uniref:AAA family ATPase n=2 Tax=Clostridium botulinum TaxID=1491 RepID=UPI003BB54F7C